MFVEKTERPQGEEQPSRERVQPLDDVSKLLLKAADVIERRGLPDCAFNHKGQSCVIVTCGEIAQDFGLTERATERLQKHVGYVPDWSDKAGREGRGAEVVAKLRAVALGGS